MRRANGGAKMLMIMLSMTSVVLFAGAMIDYHKHSDAFMDQFKLEIQEVSPIPRAQRIVASSSDNSAPRVQYVPVNEQNSLYINQKWEITRINDKDGNDIFNKFENENDAKVQMNLDFELIGTSTVRIDNDDLQIYKISLITPYDTIALFKRMRDAGEDKYEVVEAKRIKPEPVVFQEQVAEEPSEQGPILPAGLRLERDVNLTLERALHPKKSEVMMMGNSISGAVSIVDGVLQNFYVSLTYDNGRTEEFSIDSAEINDGGQFEATIDQRDDQTVHGIITNNGGEGMYRIRFATGPLQGAMLNFVTDSKFDEMSADLYAEEDKLEEAGEFKQRYGDNTQVYDQSEVNRASQAAEMERANLQNIEYNPYEKENIDYYYEQEDGINENDESYEDYSDNQDENEEKDEYEQDYYSQQELNEKVKRNGFNFNQDRAIASLKE
jgi:hypothetical protein